MKSCYHPFQFAIKIFKEQDMQQQKSAFCFIWVWNLVSHIEKGILAEYVRE
jgi:hypothetical protein